MIGGPLPAAGPVFAPSGSGAGPAAEDDPAPLDPPIASVPVDARASGLHVRLARTEAELAAAQRLRYGVFYDERKAVPTPEMAESRADFDAFDPVCDHLLVLDTEAEGGETVVGAYRLMRRAGAERVGGFYTAGEYGIDGLIATPGEVLELGRSCVAEAYRNRATMSLLWTGISQYVLGNDIKVMFGCASLPGTDVEDLAVPLSYLWHNHLAPDDLRVRALDDLYTRMDLLPADGFDAKRALAGLPPLIKGYLRLNGVVGDGAVVDRQFNTTDVCVIVKTDTVTEKYFKHYSRGVSGA